MPGPVVHAIIAEHLPNAFEREDEPSLEIRRPDAPDDATLDLSGAAAHARLHRDALVYGAQGPDPFFFNPDDWVPLINPSGAMDQWATFRAHLSAKLWEFTQPLQKVKQDVKDAGEATLDKAGEHSHIVDELTNLQARFKYLSKVISQVLRGFVKKTILDHADPFGYYISPKQTCGQVQDLLGNWSQDHSGWDWFDTLHTRRTGEFAAALLDVATGKSQGADGETRERPLLHSYAVGYLSHIAADVVGHAYVNTITGGPYRLNQSQRHTTQERVMDVWAYDRYYSDDDSDNDVEPEVPLDHLDATNPNRYYHSDELVNSGMHKNFQFTAGDVEPRDWTPDPDRTFSQGTNPPIRSALKLPDEIADNFAHAAQQTYDANRFGELVDSDVASSYRFWYKNFMSSTSTFGPVHPDELPGDVDLTGAVEDELRDVADEGEDVSDSAQNLFDALFGGGGSNALGAVEECVENVLDGQFGAEDAACLQGAANAINAYISQLASAIADLAKQVFDVWVAIFEVIEAIAAIPLRALNALLQAAYEQLWSLYTNVLMLVTALGFGTMFSDDLDNGQLRNLWDPEAPDSAGRTARDTIVRPDQRVSGFPRKGLKAGHTLSAPDQRRVEGLENDAHLLVPFGDVEEPRTIPGPDLYGSNRPDVFIDDPDDEMDVDATWTSDLYDALPDQQRDRTYPSKEVALSDLRRPAEVGEGTPYAEDADRRFREPVFGDALTLTSALYKHYQMTGEIPNLDMSGDRGIGYPTWANSAGCGTQSRERWSFWHGDSVPWTNEPIEPVFEPDMEDLY